MLPRDQIIILHGDPVHLQVLATAAGNGWTVAPCGAREPYDLDLFPPVKSEWEAMDGVTAYLAGHRGDCRLLPVIQHKDGRLLFVASGIVGAGEIRYAVYYRKHANSVARFSGVSVQHRDPARVASDLEEWRTRNKAEYAFPWDKSAPPTQEPETRNKELASPFRALPIDSIIPGANPRTTFDEAYIAGLAESIAAHGLLLPIAVRDMGDGRYQIIDGECRWRACRLAGLSAIEAVVREADDQQAHLRAIMANRQREDLNPIEEAQSYERAHANGTPIKDIAIAARRSPEAISNLRRLLKLPKDVQHDIAAGVITMAHGKALCAYLDHPEALRFQYGRAVTGASSRDIERLDYRAAEALSNAGHARRFYTARFRRDDAGCKGCNHSRGITGDGYCLNPSCFDERQAEAQGSAPIPASPYSADPGADSHAPAVPGTAPRQEGKTAGMVGNLIGDLPCPADCPNRRMGASVGRGEEVAYCTDLACLKPKRAAYLAEQEEQRRRAEVAQRSAMKARLRTAVLTTHDGLCRALAVAASDMLCELVSDEDAEALLAAVPGGTDARADAMEEWEARLDLARCIDNLRGADETRRLLQLAHLVAETIARSYAGTADGEHVAAWIVDGDTDAPSVRKVGGVCRICGCTDDHACTAGCTWVNEAHTLCSACTVECWQCAGDDPQCDLCHGWPLGADVAAIALATDLMEEQDRPWSERGEETAELLIAYLRSCERLPAGPLADLLPALDAWAHTDMTRPPLPAEWAAIEAVAAMEKGA